MENVLSLLLTVIIIIVVTMMTSADVESNTSFSNTQNTNEDPVETMIKKTGCMDFHYKVQVEIFTSGLHV